MDLDTLIRVGRELSRPSVELRTTGDGNAVGWWHGRGGRESDIEHLPCWLTVDCDFIPDWNSTESQYLSVLTNEQDFETGQVVVLPTPDSGGTELYAERKQSLAPIDAIISLGGDEIGEWLTKNKWNREWRYNSNFGDDNLVAQYEREYQRECPIHSDDVFAVLGGWHEPGCDNDWHDLIDFQLCVLTIRESEPWVEAWKMPDGSFKVIQRRT